jgi:hypothetical protein
MLRPALFACLLCAAVPSQAATIIDRLPPATTESWGNFSNFADSQNFLVRFTLAEDTSIGGLDIVTSASGARLGATVRVKIRADQAGAPATANLFSFTDRIDTVDVLGTSRIAGTTFAPLLLTAGSYWFGVSGEAGQSVGWASFNIDNNAVRTDQRSLSADRVVGANTSIHALGWRIRTDATPPVPEPATWAMLVLGFGAVGGALRSRRRAAASPSIT